MKRSVNFNGMKRWRGANANDLLATFRFLGMSDEEIKAKLLEMKAPNTGLQRTCANCGASDWVTAGFPISREYCKRCGAAAKA